MEFTPLVWTDAELDESILKLCDEFPDSRMVACARAMEHCRRSTPRGTPAELLTAMRGVLQLETANDVRRLAPGARALTSWRSHSAAARG